MSNYSVQKYTNKIIKDIWDELPTSKAYDLGMASATLSFYNYVKEEIGENKAKEIFANMFNGRTGTYLKTMIQLENEDNRAYADRFSELLNNKKKQEELSDEDRDFLEDFMGYLLQKVKSNNGENS